MNELKQIMVRIISLRRYAIVKAVAMIGLLMAGCDSSERKEIDLSDRISDKELREMVPARDSDVMRFGFDLRASPQEDALQYLPFLEYVEQATGLRFSLRFTPGKSNIVDDLGTGTVQFAAIGAGSYLEARERYGVIPLVRGLNAEGCAEYQSVIIVAPDSPIEKIEDLRGKAFAFGNITSSQGHIIPRIILAEHGLSLDDLAGYEYTGSHHNCATAVAAGRFDAGGMQDTMGRRLAEEGFIRIIHTSRFYPSSGIVANKDVPPEVRDRVRQAIIEFDPTGRDAEGLYRWERTEMPNGFVEAHDEDYAELREWLIRFGLLDEPGEEQKP